MRRCHTQQLRHQVNVFGVHGTADSTTHYEDVLPAAIIRGGGEYTVVAAGSNVAQSLHIPGQAQ